MKITVEINNFGDAVKAVAMLTALIHTSVEESTEPTPPAQTTSVLPKRRKHPVPPAERRGRPGGKRKHKVDPAIAAAPEPAEGGVAVGDDNEQKAAATASETPVEVVEPIQKSPEQKATTAAAGVEAAEPIQEPLEPVGPNAEPIEAARERLRGIAKAKGVLWYRHLLAERDVPSIFEMSESMVREVLYAVEGEPA